MGKGVYKVNIQSLNTLLFVLMHLHHLIRLGKVLRVKPQAAELPPSVWNKT